MNQGMTLPEIRKYWSAQAEEHGQSPVASWSDTQVIDMEIREILGYLAEGDRVIDIGCANGYSTVQFAGRKNVRIKGIDYIPEMIEAARKRTEDIREHLSGQVEFDVGDITALNEPENAYDKAIVVRVIINLGTWENQAKGLNETARVLKPGGLLLLSEATVQGWRRLNAFRAEWGLPDIPMPSFNLYLDQEKVIELLSPRLELVSIVDFASTYYVGTRVFKPLMAQFLGGRVDPARPDMEFNRFFARLPAAGDYGTQKLFVFRKR